LRRKSQVARARFARFRADGKQSGAMETA
jgi:hypothetical protein